MYVVARPVGEPKLGDRVWWADVFVTTASIVIGTMIVEAIKGK